MTIISSAVASDTGSTDAAESFRRPAHAADPAATLTPDQQSLDQRLRDWRKAESTRLNAPPFLVLASSALRSIVLARPRTVQHLEALDGITPEIARTHGPAIVDICNVSVRLSR